MPGPRRSDRSPNGNRGRRLMPSLADVRIRTKLGLILIIPVLAILTLTVLRLNDSNNQAQEAAQIGDLTDLSGRATALAHELHRERMAAGRLYVANTFSPDVVYPQVVGKDGPATTAARQAAKDADIKAYSDQIARTTAAAAAYNNARRRLDNVPDVVQDRLDSVNTQFGTLGDIRAKVTAKTLTLPETMQRYGLIVSGLISYRDAVSQVSSDPRLVDSLIATAALSRAKLALDEQEAVVFETLVPGQNLGDQQNSRFIATLTGQEEALVAFSLSATRDQRDRVNQSLAGDAVQLVDNLTSDLLRGFANGNVAAVDRTLAGTALGSVNDLMRSAEAQLDADLLQLTRDTTTTVQRQVLIEAAIIIAVLLVLVILAFTTARSMARTLRRLRDGALRVADHELAEAVGSLQDTKAIGQRTPEEIAASVPDAINIKTRDEIGEVAQAFQVVLREAVRIAAEQAVLRASVSAMFLNLARRSQTLVDRMIGQLDRIERGEEDPQRLAQLFQLDHLATRMRRNDENVLVLAGADTSPPRSEDAPLADVMRAAQSEVEQYERIEFGAVDDDVSVAAHAVNDVVRLLAELFDNAARFSPPDTSVIVEGRRIGDTGYIRIEDRGLGMTPEEAAAHNARFAAPPTIDVSTFRMMGLAVVSRLAYRHGIQVYVQGNPAGGTVVELKMPDGVLVLPVTRQIGSLAGAGAGAGTGAPAVEDRWRQTPPLPQRSARAEQPQIGAGMAGMGAGAAQQPAPYGGFQQSGFQQSGFQSGFTPQLPQRPQETQPVQPAQFASPQAQFAGQQPTFGTPQPSLGAQPAHIAPPPAQMDLPPVQNGAGQPLGAAQSLQSRALGGSAPPSWPVFTPTQTADTTQQLPVHRAADDDRWAALAAPVPPPAPEPEPEPEPQRTVNIDDTTEMPIFREIEATWFRTHGHSATRSWADRPAEGESQETQPVYAGHTSAVQSSTIQTTTVPSSGAPVGAANGGPTANGQNGAATPPPAPSGEAGESGDIWRTRADAGWRAAAAAASPPVSDRTRSGLPKRQPRAQLVPGGVSERPVARSARDPEEIRGRLGAYHRGVRRGRALASDGAGSNGTGTNEGNDR
jgi:signal transduction histidine kinase